MKTHKADYRKEAYDMPVEACSSASSGQGANECIAKGSAWGTRAKLQVVLCVVGTALFVAACVAASMLWYCVYVTHREETLASLHYMEPAFLLSFVALCVLTATLAGAIGTYIYIAERSEAFKAKCLARSDKKYQSVPEERTTSSTSEGEGDPILRGIPERVCDRGKADYAGVPPEHVAIAAETRPDFGNVINPSEKSLHAIGIKLNRLAAIAGDISTLLDSPADMICPLRPQIEGAETSIVAGAAKGKCDATQLGMADKIVALSRPVHARARSI